MTWLIKVSLVAPWEMADFVWLVFMDTKLNNLCLETHSWQLNGPNQTHHKSAKSCVSIFAVGVLMKCLPSCRCFLLNFPLPCVKKISRECQRLDFIEANSPSLAAAFSFAIKLGPASSFTSGITCHLAQRQNGLSHERPNGLKWKLLGDNASPGDWRRCFSGASITSLPNQNSIDAQGDLWEMNKFLHVSVSAEAPKVKVSRATLYSRFVLICARALLPRANSLAVIMVPLDGGGDGSRLGLISQEWTDSQRSPASAVFIQKAAHHFLS